MFTREQVETALADLNSPDSSVQSRANDLLLRWSCTPQSIVQAISIINDSSSESIIFSACVVAQRDIIQRWMTYVESDRASIRDMLCNRLVTFTGSDVVQNKMISLVVAIALKEWPENWPSCVQDFIASVATSPEMCVLDFKILSELIVTIHETDTITSFRRRFLIAEFDKSTALIMQAIDWSLANASFDQVKLPVIRLLKELCLTAPIEALYSEDMFVSLFRVFALDNVCAEEATIAISNLLINRADAKDVASKIFHQTLQILAEICIDQCPEHLLLFIMNYLYAYGTDIDELCFEGEDMIEDTSDIVLKLYGTILNNPPIYEHCEEFWVLWRSVLYRYYRSSRSKNPFDALQPCFQLFQSLIPHIRSSLFQAFNSATEDGKLQSVNCQASWLFLTSVDKSGMIEFLSEQKPSPQLCYSIGLVNACLTAKEERELVFKIFPNLFEFNKSSNNIEFGISLLYAISHTIRFMKREATFLNALGLCLSNFVNSNDIRIRSSAANAIFYISMRSPQLLSSGENPIMNYFLTNLNEIILQFELKNSTKIVKSLALVASSQTTPEERNRIYEVIYNGISSALSSDDISTINNGMSIIHALTFLDLIEATPLYLQLMDPLANILKMSTNAGNEMSTTSIIETITSAILKNDFNSIKSTLDGFVQFLIQIKDFREPVILSLAKLRSKFVPMEEFYDLIYKEQIEPIIPNLRETQVEAFPILRFFRFYNIRLPIVPVLLEITVHFIKDERLDVSKEASKLLKVLIIKEGDENQINEIINVRMHLLDATFTALTDTFHTPIFNSIAKTLNSIFLAVNSSNYPPEQFDNDVALVLEKNSNDKEFLISFSKALRSHIQDFPAFSSDLKEFLVTTKCASPSDKQLFKTEIKLDSLAQELMNLVSGEEKTAIVAEELEILPALQNLKIGF